MASSVSKETNENFQVKRKVGRPPKNSRKMETIVGANDSSTTTATQSKSVKPVTKAKRRITKKMQESNNIINS